LAYGEKFYTYIGIIGRVPDSSYDIQVTEHFFSPTDGTPTNLYLCTYSTSSSAVASSVWKKTATCTGGNSGEKCDGTGTACSGTCGGGSTVALDAACTILPGCTSSCAAGTTSTIAAGHTFYQLYVGTRDVEMEVAARSGAGSRVNRGSMTFASLADTSNWGLDWNEPMSKTWVDDNKDEQDLDVEITGADALGSGVTVYGSTRERYPSAERGFDKELSASGSVTLPVYTFQKQMIYLSVKNSGSDITNKHILLNQKETLTGRDKSAPTLKAKQTCTNNCEQHGTCIYDPHDPAHCKGGTCTAYCVCDYGFYGDTCEYAGLTAQTGTTTAQLATTTLKLPKVSMALSGSKVDETKTFKYVTTVTNDKEVSTLYTTDTEQVVLDCSVDDCTESTTGTTSTIGYVTCTVIKGSYTCKRTVAAPMATVTISTEKSPAYSRALVYVDGKPYPREGHNVFTYKNAVDAADTSKIVKLYKLSTRVQHTVVVVLTTSKGEILGIDKSQFEVTYSGGCKKDASGNECNNKGVCHEGYCVCFDGFFGLMCESAHAETDAYTRCVDKDSGAAMISNSCAGKAIDADCTGTSQGKCMMDTPTTCIETATGSPMAFSCTNIPAGTACTGTSAGKCMAFHAGSQYRARQDAMLQDGISSSRFINSMQRSENAVLIGKSNAELMTKKTSIQNTLETKIFDTGSTLSTKLSDAKTSTATNVQALYTKKDRNAVLIQQARLESVRLATANKEQWLDSKRSLFAHQTAMQNRLDKDYQSTKVKAATWTTSLNTEFKQARFRKNQLRFANGPLEKIADLKTETCTTDQFFKTTCTKAAINTADFTTTADTTSYGNIPR